jgi:hypothetical protein
MAESPLSCGGIVTPAPRAVNRMGTVSFEGNDPEH